jgi:glycosyltransferase involved in cell wall biosynthesis
MKIFFSVIIPTFNRADLIASTINSLLNQTFNNFEILIIDDGSTDNTEAIVSEFSDNRITYYKKENGERGAARNYGLQLAKGTYVNFFDSDDLAYSNHLETAYQYASKKRINCEVFHTGYDIKKEGKIMPSEKKINAELVNMQLIKENILSCNNVFIRKDIALENPFPEDRRMAVAEDWALWLLLASKYPFYNSPTITSTIVYHDNRSIFDFNIDKIILRDNLLIEYLYSNEKFITFYRNSLNAFRSERYTFIALFLAIKKRRAESRQYLIKSISINMKIVFTKRFWGVLKNLTL